MMRGARAVLGLVVLALAGGAGGAWGQSLRYSNHREIAIPEYATIRLGPFYSNVRWSESVGARWTQSSGAGTDFLTANRRGRIREDGWDIPVISRLDFRNYLVLGRNADIDMSVGLVHEYYPLDTQENDFYITLAEEGLYADINGEVRITENTLATLYWRPSYRTDYVDTRGLEDNYGGERYEYFRNLYGFEIDMLLGKDRNLGLSGSRDEWYPRGDTFEEQERVVHAAAVRYEQEVLPYVIGGVEYGFRETDYDSEARTDTRVQTASLFVNGSRDMDFLVTKRTTVGLRVGYYKAEAIDAVSENPENAVRDSEGMYWGADLNWGEDMELARNVVQTLGYERRVGGTFDSDLAIIDTFRYGLTWSFDLYDFSLRSEYSTVDPRDGRSGYSNWPTTAQLNYRMTRFLTWTLLSSYTVRKNDPVPSGTFGEVPADTFGDYETWVTRLGTSYDITRSVVFSIFYEHARRDGDAESAQFTRDTAQAMLTYSHDF